MKLDADHQTIKSNVGQSSQFKIEANGAAFKILSDNLYQYPIRAIVRELSTNAIDANVQAKKTLNDFEITVPSLINPQFAIEDHGVGMSEDDILNTYTSFFSSTKSGSNEQTGMFGLGSKTPFAYTSQFIIESSKDGTTNVFTAFKDDSGLPSVKKIATRDSEPGKTGTKVMFAVKEKDFSEFYKAIVMSSATWPGLPKFNGSQALYDYIRRSYYRISDATKALEVTNNVFKAEKLKTDTENFIDVVGDKFSLEMGTVLYHISTQELKSEIVSFITNTPRDYRYVIHAPIGAVSITPSREELQYDEKTKAYLNKEILGVFVNGIEIPKKASAKEKFQFFNKGDFERLVTLNKEDVCDKAKASFEKVLGAYKEYKKEIEKVTAGLTDENTFIALPQYWERKFDERGYYPLNTELVSDSGAKLKYFEKFLKNTGVKHVMIAELDDKEIKHIKPNKDGQISAGFFTVRYFSLLKGMKAKSTETYKDNEVSNNVVTLFGPKGTAQKIKDSYFGIDFELITEWSKLPDAYKVIVPGSSIPRENNLCIATHGFNVNDSSKTYGELCNQNIDDLANAIAKGGSGVKVYFCPINRNRYMILDIKTAVTQKLADIEFDTSYSSPMPKFLGDNEKAILVTGKITDLKKAKITSTYTYVYDAMIPALEQKITKVYNKYKNFTPVQANAFYSTFPKAAYDYCMKTWKWNKPSEFYDNLIKYHTAQSYNQVYEEIRDAVRYADGDIWNSTGKKSNWAPVKQMIDSLNAVQHASGHSQRGDISGIVNTYPLGKLIDDYLPYSDTWQGYNDDIKIAKGFVDYVALLEGATKLI